MKIANILQVDKKEFEEVINNKIEDILNLDILKEYKKMNFLDYDKDVVNKEWEELKKKEKMYIIGQFEILKQIIDMFNITINKNGYNLMKYILNQKNKYLNDIPSN